MTRKQDYFDSVVERVERSCNKYGYRMRESFGKIYIYTVFESWYFTPDECGCIKLMHGNGIGNCSTAFHKQFSRKMSPEQLMVYINEHERAKYRGEHINFSFTKTGAYKTACA